MPRSPRTQMTRHAGAADHKHGGGIPPEQQCPGRSDQSVVSCQQMG
jgi:hypothetical protein